MNRNPVEVDPKWNIRVLESEEKKDELILIYSTCLAYRNTWIDFVRYTGENDGFFLSPSNDFLHARETNCIYCNRRQTTCFSSVFLKMCFFEKIRIIYEINLAVAFMNLKNDYEYLRNCN